MGSYEILETRQKGNRLSVHVQYDTGEKFWYVTTADRSDEEIRETLKQKYFVDQQVKKTTAKHSLKGKVKV